MDANVSTMTMPKTMPVQNLLRYISFKCRIAALVESLEQFNVCQFGVIFFFQEPKCEFVMEERQLFAQQSCISHNNKIGKNFSINSSRS